DPHAVDPHLDFVVSGDGRFGHIGKLDRSQGSEPGLSHPGLLSWAQMLLGKRSAEAAADLLRIAVPRGLSTRQAAACFPVHCHGRALTKKAPPRRQKTCRGAQAASPSAERAAAMCTIRQ